MAIGNFPGAGILLQGSGGNVIEQDDLGTDTTGATAAPNGLSGVLVVDSVDNLIGGLAAGFGDVLSGNTSAGVWVTGAKSTRNLVVGDRIGTDAGGTNPLGNGFSGVLIAGAGGNIVGGTTPGAANLISGNGSTGVLIAGTGATGNVVLGNRIGTDLSGRRAVPNTDDGVFLNAAPGNLIGGTAAGAGNLISGNGSVGVAVVGAPGLGNTIEGNTIGADVTGAAALGNVNDGVFLDGAPGNFVGGNLVSGNGSVGVQIFGATASGNVLLGNKIGTDATGRSALPNLRDGLFLNGAPGNVIGSPAAGAGNLISGNGSVGVQIFGPAASGNVLMGNVIGADVSGAAVLPNARDGVFVNGAPGNVIGGSVVGSGNLVSGNGSVGIQLFGTGASGNRVLGNKVGTDASGLAALPNARDGVFVNGAPGNVIGGTGPNDGNLISGNVSVGLQVFGPGSSGNTVVGNRIGLNANGAPALGNAYGVFLNGAPAVGPLGRGPAANNQIAGNRIAQVFQVAGPVTPTGTTAQALSARSRTRTRGK
jgi:titin